MATANTLRITTLEELSAWAQYVPTGSRWRLSHSKADGWVLTQLAPDGTDRVLLDTTLAKRLAATLTVAHSPQRGTRYYPSQFVDALRRAQVRIQRQALQVGQRVQHNGAEYVITRIHDSARGQRNVMASDDGERFYTHATCECMWAPSFGGVRGIDLVTEEQFKVCPQCRAVIR